MDFSSVKAITVPEGNVKQIADSNGNVLWQKPAQRLYLYNSGDQCTDLTGGYIFGHLKTNNSTYSFNDTYMQLYSKWTRYVANGDCTLQTNNLINTTGYSKICIEYTVETTSEGGAYLAIGTTKLSGSFSGFSCTVQSWLWRNTYKELDITGYQGSYYVMIYNWTGSGTNSILNCYKIWLE